MCATLGPWRNLSAADLSEAELQVALASRFSRGAEIEIQLDGFFDDGKPLLGPQTEAECDAWILEVLRVIGRSTVEQILVAIDYELTAEEVRRSLGRLVGRGEAQCGNQSL